MSDRFESTLDVYLAGIFAESLSGVIKAAGYKNVLRIPEPDIRQFRADDDVITLQVGNPRAQKQSVVVESESVDVAPLVAEAVRDAIVEVSDQLLRSLPWIDCASVRVEMRSHLSNLVTPTK